jgi:hypothetical protein
MTEANRPTLLAGVVKARDRALGRLAAVAVKATESEAYARTSGTFLRATLLAQAPVRRRLKLLSAWMHALGMPTRSDVTGIAERLTNIEMRLDDLDARLDQVLPKVRKRNGR